MAFWAAAGRIIGERTFSSLSMARCRVRPIDHTQVDPHLGTWEDVRDLGCTVELVADLIVNHMSSSSPQFLDFSQKGAASQFAGMFLTFDRVFPEGARESDLLGISRPRPTLPFSPVTLASGERKMLWTTFNPEQVDIDVHHPQSVAYMDSILRRFQAAGIKMIRLDAVGYAIKKPGTSCFMIPETFNFIAELATRAHTLGIEVLVEIHSHYLKQIEIARKVDWVYDFALPPLVLHALSAAIPRWRDGFPSASQCRDWLDTHDGIGWSKGGRQRRALSPAEIAGL
jgi:sucrose phosphorylase